LSDGINIFLSKIAMDKKLPFELKLPTDDTMKAINEAKINEVHKYNSVDDLMDDLRS
jgi:DNA-damage-inducible protein J